MRVGERREVGPIEAAGVGPANDLDAFVQVEVVFAKVLADQSLKKMADRRWSR
jgi:hypothetical protein